MNKKLLLISWAGLFIVCAALGFIPEPDGAFRLVCTGLSLVFFLPPAALLYVSGKQKDSDTAMLIRNLSALSLGLTLVLLILNFLTALRSEFLGQVLHYILVIVSSPMVCSGHWALSLFLWACLLMASLRESRR
jgi:cytochrome c biogenesis protein CcdA